MYVRVFPWDPTCHADREGEQDSCHNGSHSCLCPGKRYGLSTNSILVGLRRRNEYPGEDISYIRTMLVGRQTNVWVVRHRHT